MIRRGCMTEDGNPMICLRRSIKLSRRFIWLLLSYIMDLFFNFLELCFISFSGRKSTNFFQPFLAQLRNPALSHSRFYPRRFQRCYAVSLIRIRSQFTSTETILTKICSRSGSKAVSGNSRLRPSRPSPSLPPPQPLDGGRSLSIEQCIEPCNDIFTMTYQGNAFRAKQSCNSSRARTGHGFFPAHKDITTRRYVQRSFSPPFSYRKP